MGCSPRWWRIEVSGRYPDDAVRLSSVPLLIALTALPALSAPVQLDEAWNRWMKPRSDAADQLAFRVRQSAHRGASIVVDEARTSASRQRILQSLTLLAGVLLAILLVRHLLDRQRNREDSRLRSVRAAARRGDEGGR